MGPHIVFFDSNDLGKIVTTIHSVWTLISSNFTLWERGENHFSRSIILHPVCILLRTNLLLQRAPAPLIIPPLISPFHLIRSFLHSPSSFLTCPETPSTPPPLPLRGVPLLLMSRCSLKMSFNNCIIWNNIASAGSWKERKEEEKKLKKREHVPRR